MKIGIIGMGYWGKKVFKEYLSLATEGLIDRIHVYDSHTSLFSDGIFQNSHVKIHDSYESMLDYIDAVHLCVPNEFHYKYTLKSIDAGISTMVEKPLTKNSTEAFNLVEHALEQGIVLQVGNIFRFSNSLKLTREVIKSGAVGSVNHLCILWTHMARSESSSTEDVLWDLGPHILDILNFLTESWPFSSLYNPYKDLRVDERLNQANLILDYGKFTTSIRMSLIDHMRARLVTIAGSLGTVILDPVNQNIELHSNAGIENIQVKKNNTLRDELVNFIECCRDGRTKINSGNLGAAIVRELEQIRGAKKNETWSRI